MIFGGVAEEHLQLNENTLYSDEPGRRDLPLDMAPEFDRVVRMFRRRRIREAAELITRHWCGRAQPCYQPLGDLRLSFDGHTAPSGYSRDLNLRRRSHGTLHAGRRDLHARILRQLSGSGARDPAHRRQAAQSHLSRGALLRASDCEEPAPTGTDRPGGQAPGFALRRTLEWVEQRGEQWKYPELWDKDGRRRPHAKPVLYGDGDRAGWACSSTPACEPS